MKKVAGILLFCVYLFGTTEVGQLLKLPLLYSHYTEHKAINPHASLTAFLKVHYLEPQTFDGDYYQDIQLPFKTVLDLQCFNIPTILPSVGEPVFNTPPVIPVKHGLINDSVASFLFPVEIFQPPKFS